MKVVSAEDAAGVIERQKGLAKTELERLYYGHTGKRIFKWHHYLAHYERHLRDLRARAQAGPVRILEIGVLGGGSLQLWRKYFGPNAVIYGIDIDPSCKQHEGEGCHVRIGSQDDPAFLREVVKEMGGIDMVLDDGSHVGRHQVASFRALWPLLAMNGLYVCEDLHTAYWAGQWEGGQNKPGTFIETVKAMIDEMHAWYAGISSPVGDMGLKTSLTGLHVYDSIVFLEKAVKEEPWAVHSPA
jgi:cephalosporin hydroxylase